MPRETTGKSIVITGAGTGIGAATARAAAAAGMCVVLNGRRADRLEAVAASINDATNGARTLVVTGDVTDPDMSRRLLDTAEEEFGRVDVVFANAGYGIDKPLLDTTEEELRRIFDVNLFASVDLLRHAAERLRAARRPGHLLMCSSCLSKFALPNAAAYAATKAAQNSICTALRHELRGDNIYVSSVHPITTTTEFFDVAAQQAGRDAGAVPRHTPSLLVQRPQRVAAAVIRCLRRPTPEVWTSTLVRGFAAASTFFPRFGDWAIRRQSGKDETR